MGELPVAVESFFAGCFDFAAVGGMALGLVADAAGNREGGFATDMQDCIVVVEPDEVHLDAGNYWVGGAVAGNTLAPVGPGDVQDTADAAVGCAVVAAVAKGEYSVSGAFLAPPELGMDFWPDTAALESVPLPPTL